MWSRVHTDGKTINLEASLQEHVQSRLPHVKTMNWCQNVTLQKILEMSTNALKCVPKLWLPWKVFFIFQCSFWAPPLPLPLQGDLQQPQYYSLHTDISAFSFNQTNDSWGNCLLENCFCKSSKYSLLLTFLF